ncbi:unnamed protein product [Amoebophrya sp. A25]|nr:unnamed protein product [Amoebophrya sp. A25]|eukprot:GSA25T00003367001.1
MDNLFDYAKQSIAAVREEFNEALREAEQDDSEFGGGRNSTRSVGEEKGGLTSTAWTRTTGSSGGVPGTGSGARTDKHPPLAAHPTSATAGAAAPTKQEEMPPVELGFSKLAEAIQGGIKDITGDINPEQIMSQAASTLAQAQTHILSPRDLGTASSMGPGSGVSSGGARNAQREAGHPSSGSSMGVSSAPNGPTTASTSPRSGAGGNKRGPLFGGPAKATDAAISSDAQIMANLARLNASPQREAAPVVAPGGGSATPAHLLRSSSTNSPAINMTKVPNVQSAGAVPLVNNIAPPPIQRDITASTEEQQQRPFPPPDQPLAPAKTTTTTSTTVAGGTAGGGPSNSRSQASAGLISDAPTASASSSSAPAAHPLGALSASARSQQGSSSSLGAQSTTSSSAGAGVGVGGKNLSDFDPAARLGGGREPLVPNRDPLPSGIDFSTPLPPLPPMPQQDTAASKPPSVVQPVGANTSSPMPASALHGANNPNIFSSLQQIGSAAQQAISEGVTQVQKQLVEQNAQSSTQQLETTIAGIAMTDHRGIVTLDLQIYMQILLAMRILPEEHRTTLMEQLTRTDPGGEDIGREAVQYLLLYITKLNRKLKMMQMDIQRLGTDLLSAQSQLQEATDTRKNQETARRFHESELLRQELEAKTIRATELERLLKDKEEGHNSALSVLQQTFEDLTVEHEETLRRLAALRRETGGGGATSSSTSISSPSRTTSSPVSFGGTIPRIKPSTDATAGGEEKSNAGTALSGAGGVSSATIASPGTTAADRANHEQLQKEVKGLHRDLERLLREKEEHFFERENFVDRRLVLSMASQLQSEPKPELKDQILQQMIDVLCVDETWKTLVPKRPVSTKNAGPGGGSKDRPVVLSDALIDFVDREIEADHVGSRERDDAGTAG